MYVLGGKPAGGCGVNSVNNILNDILVTFAEVIKENAESTSQINKGYLNLKWKVETDEGTYLVKQYNKKRLKKYNMDDLLYALKQQNKLYEQGFPTPKIYSNKSRLIMKSENHELFSVMEFKAGKNLEPGCLNKDEMFGLGIISGKMQKLLNQPNGIQKCKRPVFMPPSIKERNNHWNKVKKDAEEKGKLSLVPLIEEQIVLTESIDDSSLDIINTGWAHRDLFVDNVLFDQNKVTAVLDFDRMRWDYPSLDSARAIMSGAMFAKELKIDLIESYIEGFTEILAVDKRYFTNALRFLWYMESTWWIEVGMDKHIGPPIRFVEEMIWLTENYHELEEMLSGL
jgi:homoserine kinase type II